MLGVMTPNTGFLPLSIKAAAPLLAKQNPASPAAAEPTPAPKKKTQK